MDAASSKRTLDWHFRPRPEGGGLPNMGDGRAEPPAPDAPALLDSFDLDEQRRLWEESARKGSSGRAAGVWVPRGATTPTRGSDGAVGGMRLDAPGGATVEVRSVEVDGEAFRQLAEVIGEGSPRDYLRQLIHEARGDVAAACAVHFGPNGGVVPPAFTRRSPLAPPSESTSALAPPLATGATSALASTSAASSSSYAATAASCGSASVALFGSAADDEELALAPGTVAWVIGKEFKLYKRREDLEVCVVLPAARLAAARHRYRYRYTGTGTAT